MIKLPPIYEDNKTYPILVKLGGGYRIVEMLGRVVNEYNNQLRTCHCCGQVISNGKTRTPIYNSI